MNAAIVRELERLTANASAKRVGLLQTGLKKSRRRKALTVLAGVLALTSAGTFTAVATKIVGSTGVQLLAALVAGISGTCSLLIAIYYSDDEVLTMLSGSAKYLALRENVYRLVIHPDISDQERFSQLAELQGEYSQLDELYSKFFTMKVARSQSGPPDGSRVSFGDRTITEDADDAAHSELVKLHYALQDSKSVEVDIEGT